MGTIHFVDWYGLAGQSLQWVTQCSFTKVVQTRTTQRDASGLDVLVVLPGAEAVPRARPILGVVLFLATVPISHVRRQDAIPLASVWLCRQPP